MYEGSGILQLDKDHNYFVQCYLGKVKQNPIQPKANIVIYQAEAPMPPPSHMNFVYNGVQAI